VVVQVALLLLCLASWRHAARLARKWDVLLKDAGGRNVAAMLERHLETAREHDDRLKRVDRQTQDLEAHLTRSIRRAGVVKYDAFPDVGGEQSFALALLDDEGNGVVLTSIVGRLESRVFAKPVKERRAAVATTAEEEAALAAAAKWD
jgi:hypothetical protein